MPRDLGLEARGAVPSPIPWERLTAGAVQLLHDPEAVVQQGFGPHQLQAQPRGTQERQDRFHLGADLHTLEGRRLLGPQGPPQPGKRGALSQENRRGCPPGAVQTTEGRQDFL